MLEQYKSLCCESFELLAEYLSILPGTRSVVKSYSKLEKIHKKDTIHFSAKLIYQASDDEELFESA